MSTIYKHYFEMSTNKEVAN